MSVSVGDSTVQLTENNGFGRTDIIWMTQLNAPGYLTASASHPPTWCSAYDPEARANVKAVLNSAFPMATPGRPFRGGPPPHVDDQFDIGLGWPIISYSVTGDAQSYALPGPPSTARGIHGGSVQEEYGYKPFRALAWNPVYPGAITGSLAWTLLAATILFICGRLRQEFRHRRGRCPICNYDRRGLTSTGTPCPECGNQAPALSAASTLATSPPSDDTSHSNSPQDCPASVPATESAPHPATAPSQTPTPLVPPPAPPP